MSSKFALSSKFEMSEENLSSNLMMSAETRVTDTSKGNYYQDFSGSFDKNIDKVIIVR